MKTLIIYAHPNTPGHCPHILKEIEEHLQEEDADYELLDLYKMKYDPILHEDEHYTTGEREISDQNKDIQKSIQDSDRMIFIYPVWWNSMPAILKGFFDKVLTPHFAFKFTPFKVLGQSLPKKLLSGKKAALFMTTGSQWWIFHFILHQRAVSIAAKDTLGFCGIKAKAFPVYGATQLTDKHMITIKKTVKKGLKWLY